MIRTASRWLSRRSQSGRCSSSTIAQLDAKLSAAEVHADEEARRAEKEASHAEEAERQLAEALAELEKLRRGN